LILLRTFGIVGSIREDRAMLYGKDCGPAYQIKFTTILPVFYLKRKLERIKSKLGKNLKRKNFHYVVSIKKVETVPMKCIEVDSPSKLFLISNSLIPTHNSEALRHQGHSDCLNFPGIKGLLIRSKLTELKRTHIRRLYQDIPPDWYVYNRTDHVANYKNLSLLEFGFFDKPENLGRYLSAEYDFIHIDELTTIMFEIFLLLISRLAASRDDFTPYIAAATNPGDIAHRQVKSYFLDKDFNFEFPEMIPQGEDLAYNPGQIAFIPANVHDNQILMKRDPGIIKRLRSLPPRERKRFYEGSWDIFEGQFFDMLNRLVHQTMVIPDYSVSVLSID
jgi:hypothetical protein